MGKLKQSAISDDTLQMLEDDVKKKKARKFFLVYKGTQLKTLVVFKKGPFGPKIMQAKKDGHIGEICYGVVVGSGEKLTFQIPGTGAVAAAMKCDSWDNEPPVEEAKFKKFFKENGLRFKPRFEMVNDVADALDPEAEGDGASSAAAAAADDASPSVDTPAEQAAAVASEAAADADGGGDVNETRYATTLRKLAPHIKRAVAAASPLAAQLQVAVAKAKSHGMAKEFEKGLEALKDAAALIKQVAESAAEQTAGIDPGVDPNREGFETLLVILKPDLDEVLKAVPTAVTQDIKLGVSEAKVFARKENFAAGLQALQRVERLLEIAYDELGLVPEEEAELADLFPDDGEALLPAPETATEPPTAEQLAELRTETFGEPMEVVSLGGQAIWDVAKETVFSQLADLEKAMSESDDDELQGLAPKCRQAIEDEFNKGLRDALVKLDQADPGQEGGPKEDTLTVIAEYETYLTKDALVQLCDANPLEVEVSIRETLTDALGEIRSGIAKAF